MRFVLTIINVALAILAIILLAIGGLHKYHTSYITDWNEEVKVEHIVLATGCLLFVTAVVGLTTSVFNNKYLFISYGTLLLASFLLQMVMGILSFLEIIRMTDFITEDLILKFKHYDNATVPEVREEVDRIQSEWHCCGYSNVTTWKEPYPDSCCPGKKEKPCTEKVASKEDCKSAATKVLQSPLKISGTFAMMFSIFEFFLALWSFYTATTMKKH